MYVINDVLAAEKKAMVNRGKALEDASTVEDEPAVVPLGPYTRCWTDR